MFRVNAECPEINLNMSLCVKKQIICAQNNYKYFKVEPCETPRTLEYMLD